LKRSLVVGDEEEEDAEAEGGNSLYDQLGSWIINAAQEKKGGVNQLDDVEIYLKAKELGIETKHRTLTVLAQTLFDEDITKQIPKRAGMLKKMITSERHQKAFLGGTERFVGKDNPKLIPQVPAILLAYYQDDLVSEDVLKKWGSRASKKYVDIATSKKVRKAAEKFLEWLENAESDDEEEEDEEE
jgi:translation initiation factor 5